MISETNNEFSETIKSYNECIVSDIQEIHVYLYIIFFKTQNETII